MDQSKIKMALVKVLKTIQTNSGLDCPEIRGNTKPVGDLEEFDSKMWPVAIGMLCLEIGVDIPKNANIFRKKGTTIPLAIDEIVKRVEEELAGAAITSME